MRLLVLLLFAAVSLQFNILDFARNTTFDQKSTIVAVRVATYHIQHLLECQYGTFTTDPTKDVTWVAYYDTKVTPWCKLPQVCATPFNTTLDEITFKGKDGDDNKLLPDYTKPPVMTILTVCSRFLAGLVPDFIASSSKMADFIGVEAGARFADFNAVMSNLYFGTVTLFQRIRHTSTEDGFLRAATTLPIDAGLRTYAIGSIMSIERADGGVDQRVNNLIHKTEYVGPITLFSVDSYAGYVPVFQGPDDDVIGSVCFISDENGSAVLTVPLLLLFFAISALISCTCCATLISCRTDSISRSAPMMLLVILAGCHMMVLSGIVRLANFWDFWSIPRCWLSHALLYMGLTIAFSALAAKNFRIHTFLSRSAMFRTRITYPPWISGLIVATSAAVQGIVLIGHTFIIYWPAPFTYGYSTIRPLLCDHTLDKMLMIPSFTVLGLILGVSGFVAIKTRRYSTIDAMKDVVEATEIAFVAVALIIILVITVSAQFFFENTSYRYVIIQLSPAVPALVLTLGLFVPKFWRIVESLTSDIPAVSNTRMKLSQWFPFVFSFHPQFQCKASVLPDEVEDQMTSHTMPAEISDAT